MAAAITSCATYNKKILYEGFNGQCLIVYISEFLPEEKQDTPEQISSHLTEKLNQRAFLILACYVSINIDRTKVSASNDRLLNDMINSILSKGHIVEYSFNEKGYCEAYGEYEISAFYQLIDKINNQ